MSSALFCKVKVTLSLCLINYHAMDVWGSRGRAPPFLASSVGGVGCSPSRPDRLTPLERSPVFFGWETGWKPEPVWTMWSIGRTLAPSGNRTPALKTVARSYTD
jgi:hypothetical protein